MRRVQCYSMVILSIILGANAGCTSKENSPGAGSSPSTVSSGTQDAGANGAADTNQEIALTAWQPDGPLTSQLVADGKDLGGYLVRPPKGYQESIPGGLPPGARSIAWSNPRRADGSFATLTVVIGTPPPGQARPSEEQFMAGMLEGVKKRFETWSQTGAERGTINGLKFERKHWSGTDAARKRMHGVMYVAIDGGTYIQLAAQDTEPHQVLTLKLLETAILTFKKK